MIEQLIQLLTVAYKPVVEMSSGTLALSTNQLVRIFQETMDIDKEMMNNALQSAGFELRLLHEDGEVIGYRWLLKPIEMQK